MDANYRVVVTDFGLSRVKTSAYLMTNNSFGRCRPDASPSHTTANHSWILCRRDAPTPFVFPGPVSWMAPGACRRRQRFDASLLGFRCFC